MVKLFQRGPYENLLLYILFKNVPEQSGNNYDIISYLFILEISRGISMILLTSKNAQGFFWHGKENSREFRTSWQYIFNF